MKVGKTVFYNVGACLTVVGMVISMYAWFLLDRSGSRIFCWEILGAGIMTALIGSFLREHFKDAKPELETKLWDYLRDRKNRRSNLKLLGSPASRSSSITDAERRKDN